MSRKEGPLNPAKRKAKRSMRQKPLLPVLSRKRGPRDAAEAREWLKQLVICEMFRSSLMKSH